MLRSASSSVEGVEAAVAAFTAAVPPIAQDPSLITDASTPLTFAYLGANCPDRAPSAATTSSTNRDTPDCLVKAVAR